MFLVHCVKLRGVSFRVGNLDLIKSFAVCLASEDSAGHRELFWRKSLGAGTEGHATWEVGGHRDLDLAKPQFPCVYHV